MPQLKIDVIALLPEEFSLCNTCTAFLDQVNVVQKSREGSPGSYPPEFQLEVDRLAEIVLKMSSEFGERVHIRLVDPRSLGGLAIVIWHGIRHYPTLLIQGKEKITSLDWESIKHAIQNAEKQAEST
jgi:hypothetical protein